MNESARGLLLYVLIFVAAALFNYAIRRVQAWLRRREQPRRPSETPPAVRRVAEVTRRVRRGAADGPASGESDIPIRRVEALAASPTTRTVADARSLVTGRRNLRRAVIAMTVLGKCKSQQPQ